MRLLLLGSLLLGGGSAVAMQNEVVQENVEQTYNRVSYMVQHRFKRHLLEEVKETGYPYPPDSYLETLTDEQEALVLTTIDQFNATYDWANMSDEDIIDALRYIKDEMNALYDELGIDGPTLGERVREYMQHRRHQRIIDHVQENGIPYPNEDILAQLTEEQSSAVTALIDSYNATYDWATMSEDEVFEALGLFQDEMTALKEELGIDIPLIDQDPMGIKDRLINIVKEDGIPYPNEDILAQLSEEQSTAVTGLIDTYNATYDWATMTDEEIIDALQAFRGEMADLRTEYDIDIPLVERPVFPHHRFDRFRDRFHDRFAPDTTEETPVEEDPDQV